MVRNPVGPTIILNDRACVLEVSARHDGEEMMFDLIVEPAVQEIGEEPWADVASGEHLLTDEIDLLICPYDLHALMVGSEDETHVEAPRDIVDGNKEENMAPRHEEEQQREVGGEMQGKYSPVDPSFFDRSLAEEGDVGLSQTHRSQCENRVVENRLVAHDEAGESSAPLQDLFF